MIFKIYDASGNLHSEFTSWPMARAVLDHILSKCENDECPKLDILPGPASKKSAVPVAAGFGAP